MNPDNTPVWWPLAENTLLIAANDRLARALQLQHAHASLTAGAQVWEKPPIMTWSAWLQNCFSSLTDSADHEPPLLLNARQVETVWQNIIESSAVGRQLLQSNSAAVMAAEAWELLCGWQVPLTLLESDAAADRRAFAAWLREYLRRSDAGHWLDPARLADYLRDEFAAGKLVVPTMIWLAGFDELRPQQQAMLDELKARGCEIKMSGADTGVAGSVSPRPCRDQLAEIRAAAHWARAELNADPALQIAVVVHDLAAQRNAIARIFTEVLQPAARLQSAGHAPAVFNISLGTPLADVAVIHTALQLLELGRPRCHWSVFSAVLRTPFVRGAAAERDARAYIDTRLRRQGREELQLHDLHFRLHADASCPLLLAATEQAQAIQEALPSHQTAAQWSQVFGQWLGVWGWGQSDAQTRALNSDEYQAVQAWRELLAGFAGLDAYSGSLSWGEALACLQRLAARQLFQPQSANAPIQIMGMLEASGQQFDRLWIMGLHDGIWPASPRPQPFIPVAVQRKYAMPHATAERELLFAEQTTARLLASAAEIVVSWPQRDGDASLRPSALLMNVFPDAALPAAAESDNTSEDFASWLHHNSPVPEIFTDTPPPSLFADEVVRGGTALIKNQAACPFRAFAEHRLQARPLEVPAAGLDASDRGALMHNVMRAVWDELRDQAALNKLDQTALQTLVASCVAVTLDDWERQHAQSLPPGFRQVESDRLQSLAMQWLQLDAARTPFSVIAREGEQAIAIAGLTLKGQMDRMDRLDDGRHLIIDYKTGRIDTKSWIDTRPDEPQLPLYALAQRERLAGIAFARLRIGELEYAGVASDDAGDLAAGIHAFSAWKQRPDDVDDFVGLIQYWEKNLGALAQDFSAGHAEVDPKSVNKSCAYCPLPTLCRINAMSNAGRVDAGDMDDNGAGDD